MESNSWTLSEAMSGSEGTGGNTAVARAGHGCSAQRATTLGTKSLTCFPLSENLPLGSLWFSGKGTEVALPPSESGRGAECKNSGCSGVRTPQPLAGLCGEPHSNPLPTPVSPATAMAAWPCKPRKGKGLEILRATSDSRLQGKQWTDLPTFNCLICNQISQPNGSQLWLPESFLLKSQGPGTTTNDFDLIGSSGVQAQVRSKGSWGGQGWDPPSPPLLLVQVCEDDTRNAREHQGAYTFPQHSGSLSWHTSESPRDLSKIPLPRPLPRWITSWSLGTGSGVCVFESSSGD